MPLIRFHRSALPAQPWKNGGGVTREVLCLPEGSGFERFDWRVSIAHIASSGPFSSFPGVDRVITLLEGAGVHLRSADGAIDHRLDTPLAPFAFQPRIHSVMPFITYCESVCRITSHGCLSAPRASITAVSSMRLLVVERSPPKSSRSWPPHSSSAPQPPGPGLPLHAPSV